MSAKKTVSPCFSSLKIPPHFPPRKWLKRLETLGFSISCSLLSLSRSFSLCYYSLSSQTTSVQCRTVGCAFTADPVHFLFDSVRLWFVRYSLFTNKNQRETTPLFSLFKGTSPRCSLFGSIHSPHLRNGYNGLVFCIRFLTECVLASFSSVGFEFKGA